MGSTFGVDECNKTLKYLHNIMGNYKNLRVFMMKKNKGTYITTNTMMSIAKYDNLLSLDGDDIILSNLVELVMKKSENSDRKCLSTKICEKILEKRNIMVLWTNFYEILFFEYLSGFMPWRCEGYAEF